VGRAVPAEGRGVRQGQLVAELEAAAGAFIAAAPALITALVALSRAEQARAAPTHTHRLTDSRRPVSDGSMTQPSEVPLLFRRAQVALYEVGPYELLAEELAFLWELGKSLKQITEEEWARRDTGQQ
jgi:hypothetical protein